MSGFSETVASSDSTTSYPLPIRPATPTPAPNTQAATTYDRLHAAHPDRVGRDGYLADLDGYQISVVAVRGLADAGSHAWDLFTADGPKFIVGGRADTADAAWRAGCDALDEQHRLTGQLAELDTEAAS